MSDSKQNCKKEHSFGAWVEEIFNQDLDSLFGGHSIGRNPAVNVIDEKEAFVLEVSAAGYEKKDFNIEVENFRLILTAKKNEAEEDVKRNYKRREFNTRGFRRSFDLPKIINSEAISAKYKKGILTISIPKLKQSKGEKKRSVNVN